MYGALKVLYSSGPHESEPGTETSGCRLRNFHWVRWWVVFPNYHQTTSMPWLEGCPATSGAHCFWRHTAQGDGGVGAGLDGLGWGSFSSEEPGELFMLSDKFLFPCSWGAVTRITHSDCQTSVKAAIFSFQNQRQRNSLNWSGYLKFKLSLRCIVLSLEFWSCPKNSYHKLICFIFKIVPESLYCWLKPTWILWWAVKNSFSCTLTGGAPDLKPTLMINKK